MLLSELRSRSSLVYLLFGILIFPSLALGHGVSPSDQQVLTDGDLFSYIYIGAKHMITGYDHLLFLTGVIFFLSSFSDIVKFISVFTLGHCITLISATLYEVQMNEHLIDAVIAISVLYKGFENLEGFQKYFKINPPNLLWMVFAFGLIHGFGLSTRLQQFDIGSEMILAKIIAFNVGVEFGQIAALIPIIFIINNWRKWKSYKTFRLYTNLGLILAGIGLFIFQMWAYWSH